MSNKSKYPFYVLQFSNRGNKFIKKQLDHNALWNGKFDTTPFLSEAMPFGKDLAQQLRQKFHARVVEITAENDTTASEQQTATTAAPAPAPKVEQKRSIHVGFVLDHSGSMSGIAESARKAINDIIRSTIENAKQHSNKVNTSVSFWLFGVGGYPNYDGVQEKYFNQPISAAQQLTEYHPNGNTPLFDGVGTAINKLQALPDANDVNTSFLLHVITDGYENMSRKYSAHQVVQMIKDVQSTDRWTIAFAMPPRTKADFVSRYGLHEGNCREWEATTAGVTDYAVATSGSTAQWYGSNAAAPIGAAAPASVMRGFFAVDLSNVQKKDVVNNLTDVSGKFRIIKVDKEAKIEDLVSDKTGGYKLGDVFYQLTKDERVHAHKRILVGLNGEKTLYAGKEARDLLGLPSTDVKLRPQNLSAYKVFIQSTSLNRKLVRGSEIAVLKTGESLL